MTRDEIVTETAARLNYSSTEAITRLERAVDRLYKVVTSTIGLSVTREVEADMTMISGDRFLTVPSMEKIAEIRRRGGENAHRLIREVTLTEVNRSTYDAGYPERYAIFRMNASSVEVKWDREPSDAHAITVYGQTTLATLGANDEPAFPESFHDILIEGVLKDEYRKLEKNQLASMSQGMYQERLGQLRLWIAKSIHNEIYQGKLDRRTTDYPFADRWREP